MVKYFGNKNRDMELLKNTHTFCKKCQSPIQNELFNEHICLSANDEELREDLKKLAEIMKSRGVYDSNWEDND